CHRVLFLRSGRLVGDEPVALGRDAPDLDERRLVRLRFGSDVSSATLTQVIGPKPDVTSETGRSVLVRFSGGDAAQAALLATLIRANLPLLTASTPEPDLARRYMERVGREGDS